MNEGKRGRGGEGEEEGERRRNQIELRWKGRWLFVWWCSPEVTAAAAAVRQRQQWCAVEGIVAFTYDDQRASMMEKQQATVASECKGGVINEVLEGLTGLLQSPIRGAERHGLPGVLSGVALGITGLVAKPAASILEVTGKTALSIRNRSKPNQLRSQRFRVRLPRPLSRELPLRSYSWEEAVGASVLIEADDALKFKDEKLVACKALKEAGKFVVLTERFVMVVFSPSLINLGKPEFCGIPGDMEWIIELEIGLESIIHVDSAETVVHIVSSRPDSYFRQQNQHSPKRTGSGSKTKAVRWNHSPTHLPLPQTNLELTCVEDAANFLQILLSCLENGKGKALDSGRILHRANIKKYAAAFKKHQSSSVVVNVYFHLHLEALFSSVQCIG